MAVIAVPPVVYHARLPAAAAVLLLLCCVVTLSPMPPSSLSQCMLHLNENATNENKGSKEGARDATTRCALAASSASVSANTSARLPFGNARG